MHVIRNPLAMLTQPKMGWPLKRSGSWHVRPSSAMMAARCEVSTGAAALPMPRVSPPEEAVVPPAVDVAHVAQSPLATCK